MNTLTTLPTFAEADAMQLTWRALSKARAVLRDINVANFDDNPALVEAVVSARNSLDLHFRKVCALWEAASLSPEVIVKTRRGLHLVSCNPSEPDIR